MHSRAILWTGVLAASAALALDPAFAQPAPPAQSADQRIDGLVKQLGADHFEAREEAARELREIGRPALPALRRAAGHPSLEVRWRAKALVDSMTSGVRLREFAAFAALPDGKLDREQGMWLIARILNPEVKKQDLTRQLDQLASRVRERLGKGVDPTTVDPRIAVAALRLAVHTDAGFTGNVADYNHPDNSSLERVLATKKGLPILLSHVAIAVARRLDMPIVGIPTGGRYIIKYDGEKAPAGFENNDIYINPFEDFKILTREDRLREFPGYDPDLMVPPDTSREALTRMLRNLLTDLETRGEREKHKEAEELFELLEAYGAATE
jgi:hypothetical protein